MGIEINVACSEASHDRTREEEFVALLTRHKSQLFNYIFCIVQTLADAEDVFQQSTLVMWNEFEKFTLGTDFQSWASRIARFRALNFIRSKRREKKYFSEGFSVELIENVVEAPEAQDSRLHALASCREKLSQLDQRLLSLCYGNTENSIGKAAEQLGRPVRAVYDSLWRIRRALHACIDRTLSREGNL